MRTISMILALTLSATTASAETKKPASAHARVPTQPKRSTHAPAATPASATATATAATPAAATTAAATTAATPAGATTAATPKAATPAAATTTSTPAAVTQPTAGTATPATSARVAASPVAPDGQPGDADDEADAATSSDAAVATATTTAAANAATTTTEPSAAAPADEAFDEPEVKIALPAKPPTAASLRVEYQRVGRDVLKLQDQRGRFDCGGIVPRFKAIKLDTALATPASRMQLWVTLTELSTKIERLRGIKLDAACLANPLAAGCM
jgi:hypothetical protein